MYNDDVNSDTLHTSHDELDQIVSMLGDGMQINAARMVIETETSKIEITGKGDSIELREID